MQVGNEDDHAQSKQSPANPLIATMPNVIAGESERSRVGVSEERGSFPTSRRIGCSTRADRFLGNDEEHDQISEPERAATEDRPENEEEPNDRWVDLEI